MSDEVWLLLHGTPLTPAVWDGVRADLEQIRPVIAPRLPAPSSASGAQREIAVAVLAELPVFADRVHVVGHSFGGQVAIEVALLAGSQVASLTVLCSRASPFPAFASTAAAMRDGVVPEVETSIRRWFTPDEAAADGAVVRDARACIAQADPSVWADELDAIASYDRRAALPDIGAPTTVVAAAHDHVGTPEAMSDLAAAIPHATYEEVADASHMSLFLDPADLARRLVAAARP